MGLETIVKRGANYGWNVFRTVYWDGASSGEFQEESLERLGYDKKYAKYLSLVNATIFGIGGSLAWYHGGGEATGFIENIEFIQNIKEGFISFIASAIGVTSKTLLHSYTGFNALQSTRRIWYSLVKGKPTVSISSFGFASTYGKKGIRYLRNKRNKKACGI